MKQKLIKTISVLILLLTVTTVIPLKVLALPDTSENKEVVDNETTKEVSDKITKNEQPVLNIRNNLSLNDNSILLNDNFESISNVEKIEILDNNISVSMDELKKIDEEILKTKTEIEEKEKTITDVQEDYNSVKDFVNRKNLISTKTNKKGLDLFELILKSENLNDLLKSLELSKNIIKVQNKSLNSLNDKGEQLNILKKELNKKYTEFESKQILLKEDTEKLEKLKNEVFDAIRAEQLENSNMNSKSRSYSITLPIINTEPSPTAKKLISDSYNYLGIPYLWGGTTPNGFDCSGFTQYLYAKIGINIPRVSQDQQQSGTSVSLNNLKPGDLVFWGNPAHHVGIYLGDGLYIHSPHTGDVVKISQLTSATSAMRYIFD